jgi:hypothetical protein
MSGLPLVTTLFLVACSTPPPTESSIDECSNGRDDDGDGLIDCADPACRVYVFCLGGDAGTADAGERDAAPRPDGALCERTVDVVLVVDVSSSMDPELRALRDASVALVDQLRALDAGARVSLVVFVDDALAIAECMPLADGEALARELETWRLLAPENRSPMSGTLNQDCVENSLDALALAAGGCPWREGSARLLVHVTDDTFAERPTVLSGPFGGGIVVQSTYAEAVDALVRRGIRVLAVARQGVGEPCGAGRSADVGAGFHSNWNAMPSIPERTGGRALDVEALVDGRLDLPATLTAAAETACGL